MHAAHAGEKRKALKRTALELAREARTLEKAAKNLPEASIRAGMLQETADAALEEAEAFEVQARLEDLHLWEMKKVKTTKKGARPIRSGRSQREKTGRHWRKPGS